jgi:hypothetical protein
MPAQLYKDRNAHYQANKPDAARSRQAFFKKLACSARQAFHFHASLPILPVRDSAKGSLEVFRLIEKNHRLNRRKQRKATEHPWMPRGEMLDAGFLVGYVLTYGAALYGIFSNKGAGIADKAMGALAGLLVSGTFSYLIHPIVALPILILDEAYKYGKAALAAISAFFASLANPVKAGEKRQALGTKVFRKEWSSEYSCYIPTDRERAAAAYERAMLAPDEMW